MKTKKIIKSMLIIVFTTVSLLNFTNAKDYEFTNLDINADVLIDWTINVLETYTANFFVKKHGIFRTIPLNYSVQGNKFHIDISDIKVNGKKYTTSRNKWEWTIKIWDPDKYEHWKVVYPISYSTYWLIRNFSWMWYSELYWNVVWDKFDTNIWNVTVSINLPKTYTWFKAADFLITADGITKSVKDFKWTVDRSQWNKIVITYNKWLSAYQWITLSVKFPNNYFMFDDKKQSKLIGDSKNWIIWTIKSFFADMTEEDFALVFVLVVFGIAYTNGFLTKKIIKNSKWQKLKWKLWQKYHTIIQYTPPKQISSAEVWLLLHRRARFQDLYSLIYKRAADGIIDIKIDQGNNIYLMKKKELDWNHPYFEKLFFNSIVNKNLKKDINIDNKILERFENQWISAWWFQEKKWYKKYILRILLIIILLLVFISSKSFLTSMHEALCRLIAILFLFPMIALLWTKNVETEKWAELIAYILWYRMFLEKCEKPQLKAFLKEDPLYFDKTLPYVVAFGLETEFLKKIIPIMEEYNISPHRYNWNIYNIWNLCKTTKDLSNKVAYNNTWFNKWSSFWWWFSGGWWWWGGWWWSW